MAAKLAGGGGGRYAMRQNADINVTPFVDILMVLLIIFMVAVPTATTSIKLDLPPPSDKASPSKPVLISIQNSGALFLAGQATSLDTLAGDLNARFKANGQTGARGPAGDDQRPGRRALRGADGRHQPRSTPTAGPRSGSSTRTFTRNSPSPLAGEGVAKRRMRGRSNENRRDSGFGCRGGSVLQPLTRPRYRGPPSPARGEGIGD
jgi:biopolymer transport protein ExbD